MCGFGYVGSVRDRGIWHAGSNTSHINAATKGLLAPYEPSIGFALPDQLHADDWTWTGFYTGAIGFITNTDFLAENNVAIAYPYTSGTAYTTWATRIRMVGLDDALDWWEKFDRQSIHHYTNSGTGYEIGGLSLIAGGPEPELGKRFIDWCFTHNAQDFFQRYNRSARESECDRWRRFRDARPRQPDRLRSHLGR